MEPDHNQLASLFPDVAAQLRRYLSTLHMVAAQLIPEESREQDPVLDAKAALFDQSYYQILQLVNHLSSASLLTSDHPLLLQNRDIVALVSDVSAKAGSLAQLLDLQLRFICAMDRHVCAISQDHLEQLLYHLLSNAFKFTPAGGVVTVELRRSGKMLLLSVTDTGCGISEERLPLLFDRCFHPGQMDPPPHGLGLGLPLCRRIAEGHGGTLMAESREGKGSRFTVSIPDRVTDITLSDIPVDYAGGFNRTLLALADALPAKAFLVRNQD